MKTFRMQPKTWPALLTRCRSMLIERRLESNNSCSGTMLIGDCLRPRVQRPHSGFSRPQKFGPGEEKRKSARVSQIDETNEFEKVPEFGKRSNAKLFKKTSQKPSRLTGSSQHRSAAKPRHCRQFVSRENVAKSF